MHIPGLDGLRAIAVLFVLLAHFGLHFVVPGGFGVTLFFFISGALITGNLLSEIDRSGGIDVKAFYLRRFFRLYPALVVLVVLSACIYPLFGGRVTLWDISAALFYYANYYNYYVGFMQGTNPLFGDFSTFGILWSLAVEEQYYLLFPLLIAVIGKSDKLMLRTFVGVALFCICWRTLLSALGEGSNRIYSFADTRIDSILYGALLVLINRVIERTSRMKRIGVLLQDRFAFGLGIFGLLLSFLIRDDWFRDTLRYSLQGISLMPVVQYLCFSGRQSALTKLLEASWLRRIGALSYSLYLFHGVAIVVGENAFEVSYLDPIRHMPLGYFLLVVPLTFLLAHLSLEFVEKPMNKYRRRFGSTVSVEK